MKLQEQEIMVYSGEHGYFTRLASHNNLTDEWENAFVYLQFRKGTEIPTKTKIKINDGWLTFYRSKKSEKTILYVFVNDYELVL